MVDNKTKNSSEKNSDVQLAPDIWKGMNPTQQAMWKRIRNAGGPKILGHNLKQK